MNMIIHYQDIQGIMVLVFSITFLHKEISVCIIFYTLRNRK